MFLACKGDIDVYYSAAVHCSDIAAIQIMVPQVKNEQKPQVNSNKHHLFSYGTLQSEKVQIENYGRLLKGEKDRLLGYKLGSLKITDTEVLRRSGKDFHPIAIKTGNPNDVIDGTIFEITEEELSATDKYEVSDYERVLESFASGNKAWVYIAKSEETAQ